MIEQVAELLGKFPDGVCMACLCRLTQHGSREMKEIVDDLRSAGRVDARLVTCPECGGHDRVVRLGWTGCA